MKNIKDPFEQREAKKYDNPIASRELIMEVLDDHGAPMSSKQLEEALHIEEKGALKALGHRLKAMERDGQLIRNRRNGYGLVSKMDLVPGRVIGHPDGFGFLSPDGEGSDLFLSAREMRAVMDGDRVVARVSGIDKKGRREGAIVEVLEHVKTQIVGRFCIDSGIAFVIPENKRVSQEILVPKESFNNAKPGQIVTVDIVEPPTRYRQPVGAVVEILGDRMAPGLEIDIAIRDHDLPQTWPEAVEKEMQQFTSSEVPESAKQGREDIRDLPLVTIDGEDARDFDDAVHCEKHGNGWKLRVAIADVSHYVKSNSALDKSAIERGNSVYFPNRVIPMLPEVLSNGLCSINPDVDRLCMVCEMQINSDGEVTDYRFFEGLMRSHARFTYTKVAAIIEGDQSLREEYNVLVPHIEQLHKLYLALRKQRDKRGAIDFDTQETQIIFCDDKKIDRIIPTVRNDAHKLIEEMMIAANVSAANFLIKHHMPTLFRTHEGPSSEKLADLRDFLGSLGLSLQGAEDPQPGHYSELIEATKDRADYHLIQTVLLRSLSRAVYTPDNTGHFGLAFGEYLHFTSPIRRYPDLLVHRAIRHIAQGKKVTAFNYTVDDMDYFGEHCSGTERRADEATRDAIDWLKCEYMQDKIDEEFDGIITGVTNFGVFVELAEVYVEGLVHVTGLGEDYFHFDHANHRLYGERTRQIYRLADKLRVKVARVDLDERKIDFELVTSSKKSSDKKASDKKPSDKKKPRKNTKNRKKKQSG
ncbi:MAG: ribonuclease R [Gammaproteobacteria bacterium]|nr:ribonuclease R [Gammaproteobacteria bacterium]